MARFDGVSQTGGGVAGGLMENPTPGNNPNASTPGLAPGNACGASMSRYQVPAEGSAKLVVWGVAWQSWVTGKDWSATIAVAAPVFWSNGRVTSTGCPFRAHTVAEVPRRLQMLILLPAWVALTRNWKLENRKRMNCDFTSPW